MPEAYEDDLRRLADGTPLSWAANWRLMHRDDPRVVAAVLDGLCRTRVLDRYVELLGRLALLSRHECIGQRLAQPDVVAHLVRDLTAADSVVRRGHLGLFETVGELLWAYRVLFARAGAAGVAPMRELLDGLPTESRHSKPREDAVLSGAKALAIEVIRLHGGPDDARRLQRFVENSGEPYRARAEAALAWHGLVGAATAEVVAEHLVAGLGVVDNEVEFVRVLGGLGRDLVPSLLALLDHEDYVVRRRATELLVVIGAPAVASLSELLLGEASPTAARHALAALERIDLKALANVRRRQLGHSRGLSRARPEAPGDRGLSRVCDGVPEELG